MNEKNIPLKNCLISAVGKNSFHKLWTKGTHNFDVHLIVYDDSIDMFRNDADYVCHIKGYKLKVIYKYLEANPHFLDVYDYFFFPDDDIKMDATTINALFDAMRRYDLKIAQPALRMSYYSWQHTLYDRYCKLRYTNFVEMMVPCFSQEALKKVLFTFDENETGWGTETHWPLLIEATQRDMAIIDEVRVVHTRPIQSGQAVHMNDLAAYLRKYKLTTNVEMYESVHLQTENIYCCSRETFLEISNTLFHWINGCKITTHFIGENGYFGYAHFLFLYAGITQSQENADLAFELLVKAEKKLGVLLNDMSFDSGITGCFWLIEYLISEGFLEDDPETLLVSANKYLLQYYQKHKETLTWRGFAGLGKLYLQANNIEMINEIALALQNFYRMPQSFDEINLVFDTLEILNACNIVIDKHVMDLKQCANNIEFSQVEHAYFLFRIYKLTHEEHVLLGIQKELYNLRPQLMDLADALKLAEMLYYNPIKDENSDFICNASV